MYIYVPFICVHNICINVSIAFSFWHFILFSIFSSFYALMFISVHFYCSSKDRLESFICRLGPPSSVQRSQCNLRSCLCRGPEDSSLVSLDTQVSCSFSSSWAKSREVPANSPNARVTRRPSHSSGPRRSHFSFRWGEGFKGRDGCGVSGFDHLKYQQLTFNCWL